MKIYKIILLSLICLSILIPNINAENIDSILNTARGLIQKNNNNAAIKELGEALKIDPKSYEANFLMGYAYYKNSVFPSAIKYLGTANKIKEDYECSFLLGNAYFERSKFKESNKYYSKAEKISATPELLIKYAESLTQVKDYKSAIEKYRQVIEIDKSSIISYIYASELFVKLNDFEAALDILNLGKQNNPEEKEITKRIPDIEVKKNIVKSEEYLKSGQYADALKCFDNILQQEPNNFLALVKKANTLYLLSKLDEAIIILQKIEQINPGRIEILKLYGMIYNKQGKYTDAIKNLKTVISKKKTDFQSYYQIGYSYEKIKSYKLAIQNYKSAIKIKESFGPTYIGLARIYLEQKNYKQAEDMLKMAKKNGQKNLDKILNKVTGYKYIQKGNEYFDEKGYENALKNYSKALNYLNSPAIYISMANCELELKNQDSALQHFNKSLDLDSNNYNVLISIADIYKSQGNSAKYDNTINKISELKDSSPDIWINIGLINEEKGDLDEAEKAYKTALKIQPGFVEANEKLAFLLYNKAIKEFNKEKYDKSETLAKSSLEYNPNFFDAEKLIEEIKYQKKILMINSYIKKADRYASQGSYFDAIELYNDILKLKPDFTEIKLKLCRIYLFIGKYKLAEGIINHLMNNNLEDPKLFELAAVLYYEKGDYNSSKTFALRAEKVIQNANVYNILGLNYYEQNDFTKAKKQFNKAKSIKKNFSDAYVNLGNIYYKEGSYSLAEIEYKTVLNYDPKDPVALHNLGIISYKKNRLKESLNYLKRALAEDDKYHGIYFGIGRTQYYLKMYNESQKNLEKAYSLKKDIVYNWALGMVYAKLIHKDKNNLKKAIDKLTECVENKENDTVSVLARKTLVKLMPKKAYTYKNRRAFKAKMTPIIAGERIFYYSAIYKGFICKNYEGETILWKNLNLKEPKAQYIFGDKIYYADNGNKLYCIDPYSGSDVWNIKINALKLYDYKTGIVVLNNNKEISYIKDGNIIFSTKLDFDSIDDVKIDYYENNILISDKSDIKMIDINNGNVNWTGDKNILAKAINESISSFKIESALIEGINLFIVAKINRNSYFFSINSKNNNLEITKKLVDPVKKPVLNKGLIILVYNNGKIDAFDKSGKSVWKYDLKSQINGFYLYKDSLYLTTTADRIYNFDSSTGKKNWDAAIDSKNKDNDYTILYKAKG